MSNEKYKVDVPEGISGDWRVERFTVTKDDASIGAIRAAFSSSSRGRYVPAGTYTRLMRGRVVVMSDTPDEIHDHHRPIAEAKGVCLINGLGLGMVANAMLMKPEVRQVDVIERSSDVIALVGPHWQAKHGNRLRIIEADALEFRPPRGCRYDVVWHDIWDYICIDNLEDMKRLHRTYGRRCDWQGSWARQICEQNH